MRETTASRVARAVADEAIDEAARRLMDRAPAEGFGGRVVARIRRGPAATAGGPRFVALAARMAAAVVLLAVAAVLWHGRRPVVQPVPAPAAVATRTLSGPPGTAPPAREVAPASPSRPTRDSSRADRLWASRATPVVERVAVAPVERPDPVTVAPLQVDRMTFENLAVEPLSVEALDADRPTTPQ